MSNLEGLVFSLRATDIVGPINKEVTAVLFINPESPLTTDIVVNKSLLVLPPATRNNQVDTTSSTRPSNKAPLITKIDPRIIIICELKPANACAVSKMPVNTSAKRRKIVTRSTGNALVANNTTAKTSKLRTMTIGSILKLLHCRKVLLLLHTFRINTNFFAPLSICNGRNF